MAIGLIAISIDGANVIMLAQFWADVLDQPVNPGATGTFAAITTRDGLQLLFHQVPEGKVDCGQRRGDGGQLGASGH